MIDSESKSGRKTKMSSGLLKADFLEGLKEAEISPANFNRILALARVSLNGSSNSDVLKDQARELAIDVEGFRKLALSQQLKPLLVEVAVIDDDSWELSRNLSTDNQRNFLRQKFVKDNGCQQPMFASLICSYEEFASDTDLLKIWHCATANVVDDGFSLVGTPEFYNYVHLNDQFTKEEIDELRNKSQSPCGLSADERPGYIVVNEEPFMHEPVAVALPALFPFGGQTSNRLNDDQLENYDPDFPKHIVHRLMNHFAEKVFQEKINLEPEQLILLIVPFSRQRLWRSEGFPRAKNPYSKEAAERPGGGIFLLCSDVGNAARLDDRIQRASFGLWWLVIRSVMIEAREERERIRQADLAQYGHIIHKSVVTVLTHARNAKSDIAGIDLIPSSVIEEIDTTVSSATRLDEIGELARDALLLHGGRGIARVLDLRYTPTEFSEKFEEIVNLTKDIMAKTLKTSKELADRESSIVNKIPDNYIVQTSRVFLESLLSEIVKNVLKHGGHQVKDGIPFLNCSLFVEDEKWIVLRAANPIKVNVSPNNLRKIFNQPSVYLGLSHLELLGQVYNLPSPYFAVESNDAITYCVLGKATKQPNGQALRRNI